MKPIETEMMNDREQYPGHYVEQNIIPLQTSAQNGKYVPDHSQRSQSDEEDYSEVGGTDFKTNQDNKHGRKPKGDESIANRGVTKPNPNKDKAI